MIVIAIAMMLMIVHTLQLMYGAVQTLQLMYGAVQTLQLMYGAVQTIQLMYRPYNSCMDLPIRTRFALGSFEDAGLVNGQHGPHAASGGT